jgi:antitoxin (DNA-binding transcriptional repressor) of toxin-antitoxin stability system
MKTISLRTLIREPLKVKRMTRSGNSVQVTDNGEPLWILQPVYRRNSGRRIAREAVESQRGQNPGRVTALRT